MKISICTPTYNDARYLNENIQSVMRQTHANFEHIIIDGSSTDGTVDICRSYEHIRCISESDDGMYDAINKGIKMATGEVIAYLNADDRYYENAFELVIDYFADHPDVEFVYGNCTYIDQNERPITTFRSLPYIKALLRFGKICWAQPAFFWRREVNEKIGLFDSTMRTVADYDFFKRVLFANIRGGRIPRPLAKFMIRMDSISFTMKEDCQREANAVSRKYQVNNKHWMYIINWLWYYLMNVDTYLKYAKFYIPYKFGSIGNFIRIKMGSKQL